MVNGEVVERLSLIELFVDWEVGERVDVTIGDTNES